MSLREEIKAVLNPPHDVFKIVNQFEAWTKTHQNRQLLLNEADLWVLQLYEMDVNFFTSFLSKHIPKKLALIQEVCKRAEADGQQILFSAYYAQVNRDTINQEIQEWIQQKLSAEEIANRFRWRYGHPEKLLLTEESCIALYKYEPQIWENLVLNEIFIGGYYVSFENNNPYKNFRTLVENNISKEKSLSLPLHQALVSRFASPAEKRAEVKRIIENTTSWQDAEQQITRLVLSITEEETELIQKRFAQEDTKGRKSWLSFLFNYSEAFFKRHIETELAKAKNEEQIEAIANELRQKSWRRFYEFVDSWILKVYELAPAYCLTLLAVHSNHHYRMSVQTATALLKMIQAQNHREMLRFVYPNLYNEEKWNAAILDIVRADMPLREKTIAIEDLDFQPRYSYPGNKRPYLNDDVAASLYQLSPSFLNSFILHNIDPKGSYSALLKAAEGREDYYKIFRLVADGSMWKAEMQDLLRRDIPAEQIEAELERYQLQRRSFDGSFREKGQMDASILKGFIDKYGEAVLPYFERYIRWATESRIESLLALDIDRAELLRELNVLARREPQEFSAISSVWAIPLYERGASFFESFLIRYMGRQNEYMTRQLLVRAKADKQRNLFRALYRLVASGQEWNKEFNQFVDSNPTDESLEEFVEFYDIANWDYTLSDNLAAKLFQRNPDKFAPFIQRHLSQQARWGNRQSYTQLLKVSEAYPSHHLLFLKNLAYEKYWTKQIQALLDSDMSGEAALSRLEELHPRNTWEVRETALLHKVLDKYGADVVAYIITHLHWVKHSDNLMEKIENVAPQNLFWEAVFKTINWHGNSGWSYKRWTHELEALCKQNLSDEEVKLILQTLSPSAENRWVRYQIPEGLALQLYRKFPNASRGFLQRYYQPAEKVFLPSSQPDNTGMLDEAMKLGDEEMLDYLGFRAMEIVNTLIASAFPRHPQYQGANKKAEQNLNLISNRIIERFESLYQRNPQHYVRHAALMLAWWRPFAIWNSENMETHSPIYRYIVSQHLEAWMDEPEAIREVLESPNIFVQLIALHILQNVNHALVAQRILENKRIFRQLLLGRARRSTKRLALNCIERAIAQNPDFAPLLLPVLEEAADFYGRLAMSEEMMISITRIKYALEENQPLPAHS